MTITTTISLLSELQQELQRRKDSPLDKHVFVGFDGFVDSIKKAVKQKQNTKTIYFKTLAEFSHRIDEATGKSGQVEMVTQKIKLGGNAPIFSNTLGRLGVSSFCVGSLGYPVKHQAFSDMHHRCQAISVLNPGHSDAIEFEDGKIIFSELSVFDSYDWAYIKKTIGLDKIRKIIDGCQLLAFVDWVNLPHASDIWEGILQDVIKPSVKRDFLFLFDLCDPSKKTTEQIDEVLDLMSCFSPFGKVTLGLNENETLKIWAAINGVDLDLMDAKTKIPPVRVAGDYVHKAMNIDYLLVHPIDRTILYHQHDTYELQGRLVMKPKVLTGGGDNLNAGYCLGLLYDLSLPQCLVLGMAASGAYIQNGFSPSIPDILNYLRQWIAELDIKGEETEPVITPGLSLSGKQ